MIRIQNIKMSISSTEDDLIDKCKNLLKTNKVNNFKIRKKSIDARDKSNIYYVFTVDVKLDNEDKIKTTKDILKIKENKFSFTKTERNITKPIIVGTGPSGLFAAIGLMESGIPSILIEQGKMVDERVKDIDEMKDKGILNTKSNIQFGEGGAGTFSDGKLTTGVNDEKIDYVLETFVKFGAPSNILYSSKPHIGTDILIKVIRNIRNYLISGGCEFLFNTKMTDLIIDNDKVIGVTLEDIKKIYSDHVILAIGHSSRDTYEMLCERNIQLEQKNFAMGVRIEHKQEMIQKNQYGDFASLLEPTDYKLVSHLENGRSVYTFCVCPGGEVVPASSEEGLLAINGMSEYKRDKENINGALLVSINIKDYENTHPLAGMYMQRSVEKDVFNYGGGNYYAPCQMVGDFLNNKESTTFKDVVPSYKPGVKMGDLRKCLPSFITDSLVTALEEFDKKIKGFKSDTAILTAVESRSSAPVRIVRDDHMNSLSHKGLYPIGEGAGYAGGIMTSALDGIKCALEIGTSSKC